MFRWVYLILIGIAAASMVMAATVHAAEIPSAPSCISVEAGKQEPTKNQPGEKSVPLTHAGCHAPAASLPAVEVETDTDLAPSPTLLPLAGRSLVSQAISPDIRRPIA